jgi:hypothetical protein
MWHTWGRGVGRTACWWENLTEIDLLEDLGRDRRIILKWLLTLILLTWRIWWVPNNAGEWQMDLIRLLKS